MTFESIDTYNTLISLREFDLKTRKDVQIGKTIKYAGFSAFDGRKKFVGALISNQFN